mgnify:CR=1 FL=1
MSGRRYSEVTTFRPKIQMEFRGFIVIIQETYWSQGSQRPISFPSDQRSPACSMKNGSCWPNHSFYRRHRCSIWVEWPQKLMNILKRDSNSMMSFLLNLKKWTQRHFRQLKSQELWHHHQRLTRRLNWSITLIPRMSIWELFIVLKFMKNSFHFTTSLFKDCRSRALKIPFKTFLVISSTLRSSLHGSLTHIPKRVCKRGMLIFIMVPKRCRLSKHSHMISSGLLS